MDAMTAIIVAGVASMVVLKALDTAGNSKSAKARSEFEARYGASLPSEFSISPSVDDGMFSFSLEFPRWRLANEDGTSQIQREQNSIVWGTCRLHVSGFDIACKDPRRMYDFVVALRNIGVHVARSGEELEVSGNGTGFSFNSVSEIIMAFEKHPTDFEVYCASIYEALGYDAVVTPPVNDGGYDIMVTSPDMTKTIVECKCFSEGNTVGRPLVQKLVGANSVIHAENMAYITTSKFTSGAVKYANQAHVKLVDGDELLSVALSLNNRSASTNRILTTYDIESRFPMDWFASATSA